MAKTGQRGGCPIGATVSVQATAADAHTRITWEGKLPDGTTPTEAAFTFTITEETSLYVRFSHPWEYDASAEPKTISDVCA